MRVEAPTCSKCWAEFRVHQEDNGVTHFECDCPEENSVEDEVTAGAEADTDECNGQCCGGCEEKQPALPSLALEGAVISGMLKLLEQLCVESRARVMEVVTALVAPIPAAQSAQEAHWGALRAAAMGDD